MELTQQTDCINRVLLCIIHGLLLDFRDSLTSRPFHRALEYGEGGGRKRIEVCRHYDQTVPVAVRQGEREREKQETGILYITMATADYS
jgi:hypothetical protein